MPGFGGGLASGLNGGGGAGMGGAVFTMQGQLTVLDSTVVDNAAAGGTDDVVDHAQGIAGAVFNLNGIFDAIDSTFAGNIGATYASQIYNIEYDETNVHVAQTTLRDTIVYSGVGGGSDLASLFFPFVAPAGSSAKADVSQFDLVGTTNAQSTGAITGTPLSGDPKLGPLQNNGGPTQTMAPAAGSPAIDTGSAFGQTTDQRGDPRPVDFPGTANAAGGDAADIGAFETQQACTTEANPSEACHALSVRLAGTGSGSVAGATGISCPGTCAGSFGASQTLTLTATPQSGSTFTGWSGACTGRSTCKLAMSADRSVTATFTKSAPSISLLKQSASAWREGSKLAQISRKQKKPPVGTTFSFSLSDQASITLTFKRSATGRRVRGKCVAQTRSNKHQRKCTLTVAAGSPEAERRQGRR
jgi:hypothetical protein